MIVWKIYEMLLIQMGILMLVDEHIVLEHYVLK